METVREGGPSYLGDSMSVKAAVLKNFETFVCVRKTAARRERADDTRVYLVRSMRTRRRKSGRTADSKLSKIDL